MLEGFASPEEVSALKSRADELVDKFEPDSNRSVFSTTNQVENLLEACQNCLLPSNGA